MDNNGRLAKKPLRGESLRDYENRIATSTEPSVAVDAEKVEFCGSEVVVLRVQENPVKPVAVKGRCYIRKGSVNHQMTPSEIAECHLKTTGGSMDAVLVDGATIDDLDMERVREYMKAAKAAGRRDFSRDEDPWTVLRKFQLVKSEQEITRAAYLLFAREPQIKFPQAIIHAGAFREQGALILDSCDVSGNIQGQIEQTLAFIKRNIRRAIIVSGKAEHDRYWEYPTEALREALANAVCHRDYGQANDIQVKILEDRQAFYDMHIIEHYGSGMRRMKKDCDDNGSPYPVMKNGNGEFRITFSVRTKESVAKIGIPPEKFGIVGTGEVAKNEGEVAKKVAKNEGEVAKKVAETKAMLADKVSAVEMNIIECILGSPMMSQAAIAGKLGMTRQYIGRCMDELQKRQIVRHVGPKKGGHWELVQTKA